MRVILLRHSESKSNKADKADSQMDVGLTKKGHEDATNLIPSINKLGIDIFVVSSLKRSIQTIQPFLDTLDNPKIVINDLILERDLGNFTGTRMGTFQKYCKENNYNTVSYRPEGGESLMDTYERAKKFLFFLKDVFKDKTILICGHKNFLMCFEILIKGLDMRDYYTFNPLKNSEIRVFEI